MGISTFNGHRVTTARATIPAWGCWHASVSIDGEVTIAAGASATLKIADLTLVGTVLSGGPAKGRSTYRIVAGAGGWGHTIARKAYANDANVKRATVLGDAAREVGETLATIDASERVGPAWVRPEGPASALLNDIAPEAWYVDEAGTTRLGARSAGALVGKVTRVNPVDLARGKVVLAAESIATILPGLVVDGLTAVDVQHDVSPEGGLRSTVWGAQSPNALGSLRALVEALDPDRRFRGVTEYRVVTLSDNRLNLQPTLVSTGMPDLERVPMRPGVAGCYADVALGSRVLVGFVNSDAARPYVAAFEDADGSGFVPTTLNLLEGSNGIARVGDEITISSAQILAATAVAGPSPVTISLPLKGTISTGSTKVQCG